MSNPVLAALKTGRQLASTAGLVGAIFGLPALMAGGVVLPDLMPPQAVEWMGDGGNDPVVTLTAEQLGLASAAPAGASESSPATAGEPDGTPATDGEASTTKATPAPERADARSTARQTRSSAKRRGNRGTVRKAVTERTFSSNRGVSGGAPRAHTAAERAKARYGRRCRQPMDGITHLYGTRYVVERDVIQRFSSMEAALQLARVDWARDDNGRIEGFQVLRTPCNSPLFQVDIQTGDVIHSINGKEIRSLPQAFSAVRKLKRHDALHIELSRNGRRSTRTVTVD